MNVDVLAEDGRGEARIFDLIHLNKTAVNVDVLAEEVGGS